MNGINGTEKKTMKFLDHVATETDFKAYGDFKQAAINWIFKSDFPLIARLRLEGDTQIN